MDEISRLIQFPSMFKSIEKGILQKFYKLFPFFNLFSILNSLRYQSELIDLDQEYYPPALCNDGLYTWYKMGQLAKEQKKSDIDEFISTNEKRIIEDRDNSTLVERESKVIDINSKEKVRIPEKLGELTSKDTIHYSNEIESPKFATSLNEKVVVKSTFYKKSNLILPSDQAPHHNLDEKEDIMELSGFARFLKGTGRHGIVVPERMDITVINVDISKEEVAIEKAADEQKKDLNSGLQENIEEAANKKKKLKKLKKKEFVNHLVQQSIHDNDLLISEPFAEILYAQGYKEKAVKIYEKLMEKYPEKKINFAAKIDKINKENI